MDNSSPQSAFSAEPSLKAFSAESIRPSLYRALSGLWAYTLQKQLVKSKWFGALCFIFLLPAIVLYAVNGKGIEGGSNVEFYDLAFRFDFLLVVPFACVASLGGVIREEMQHDTLVFLGTRPVTRIELLGGIYLCQTVFIQILALLHFVVFLAVGAMKSVDGLMQVAPIWFVAQFLAIWVWSALGLALGLISKRYLALAAFYAGLVEMGLYRIPTNIRSLSMRVHLESLLSRSETLLTQFDYQAGSLTINLLALGAGTSIALLIAGLLYNFKEYHATEEMQK